MGFWRLEAWSFNRLPIDLLDQRKFIHLFLKLELTRRGFSGVRSMGFTFLLDVQKKISLRMSYSDVWALIYFLF